MHRLDGWQRPLRRIGGACALQLLVISTASAQQRLEGLTQGSDIVTAPSIVRVALVFLLMAVVAVGAAFAIRRYSPKFAHALVPNGRLRVIERTALQGGLRLHLVEASGERILIAEGRAGISMLRLTAVGEAEKND